jgi:integrase
MVERAAIEAGINAHAHMLRHACGYKLAKAIQAYLGHRSNSEYDALYGVGAAAVHGAFRD